MIPKKIIDEFLVQKPIAVIGVSRDPKKFGYICYRDLKMRGFPVIAVNPKLNSIDGEACYPDLKSLPEKAAAVLIVVPPVQTEKVVVEALQCGIGYIWMQKGSESPNTIEFCRANGINVIYNQCILMFAQPVESFHKFHKFFVKLLGRLPK
jgi:predicted CoA-binding protein